MKKVIFLLSMLMMFFFGCQYQKNEIEILILNDYEVIIEREKYELAKFKNVFQEVNKKISNNHKKKYTVKIKVYNQVTLKSLQTIKEGIVSVKDDIEYIYYASCSK